MQRFVHTLFGTLLLLLCTMPGALPLRAQETRPGTITVSGEVLDALTGAPVKDVVVRIADGGRSAVTDAQGRFTLRNIPGGTRKWVVGRLGYATWEQELAAEDGAEYTVRILPRPEVLEGITVVADRFERRRRTVMTTVRAVDQKNILSSAAANAYDVVRYRGSVLVRSCRDGEDPPRCATVRGRIVRVAVYIDDVRAPGGMEDLVTYLPQEIYLVEAYNGGAAVRVYTTWYAERLARTGQALPPITW